MSTTTGVRFTNDSIAPTRIATAIQNDFESNKVLEQDLVVLATEDSHMLLRSDMPFSRGQLPWPAADWVSNPLSSFGRILCEIDSTRVGTE